MRRSRLERGAGERERRLARNRREAMQEVAERVAGTFVQGKMTGGYAIVVDHGPWKLTLDTHMVTTGTVSTMHTRVATLFLGREDLKLIVRARTFWDRLAEKLGWAHRPLGGRELSRRYVVKGRPESRVRSILSGGLVDALLEQPSSPRLEVGRVSWWRRRALGSHARYLHVLVPGIDTDVDRMVGLVEVGREALEVLRRSGAASAERPPEA